MIRAAVALAALALVAAPSALACNAHPTQAQLEGEVMCPVCGTTLDQSDSPAAQQIKRVIRERIHAGDSDCRIKDALMASYGESILAAPRRGVRRRRRSLAMVASTRAGSHFRSLAERAGPDRSGARAPA